MPGHPTTPDPGGTLPHDTSDTLRDRIESLYGQPLNALRRHAEAASGATLLGALLSIHTDLAIAERAIDFEADRLRQFIGEDRDIGPFVAGHILSGAQRLHQAVAARDAHAKALSAALHGLRRNEPTAVPAALERRDPPARTR